MLEPKVFALLVKSPAGQILHIGAHFTLEEAYSVAVKKVEQLPTYNKGDMVDIDLWNTISAKQVMSQIFEPSGESDNEPNFSGTPSDLIAGSFTKQEVQEFPPALQELLNRATVLSGDEMFNLLAGKMEEKKKDLSTEPVMVDYIQHAKDARNDLMKKLIEDGNVEAVEKVKSLLGTTSRKYVLEEIEKKNAGTNNK